MRRLKSAHKTQTPPVATQVNRNDETLPWDLTFPKLFFESVSKKGYIIPHFYFLLTCVAYLV